MIVTAGATAATAAVAFIIAAPVPEGGIIPVAEPAAGVAAIVAAVIVTAGATAATAAVAFIIAAPVPEGGIIPVAEPAAGVAAIVAAVIVTLGTGGQRRRGGVAKRTAEQFLSDRHAYAERRESKPGDVLRSLPYCHDRSSLY